MNRTRVQVTGIGFVTPLGCSVESFDDALFNGHSAVRARTLEIEGLEPVELATAACDFDAAAVRSNSRLPLDRGTVMALVAARDAADAVLTVMPNAAVAELALQFGAQAVAIGDGDARRPGRLARRGHRRRTRRHAHAGCDGQLACDARDRTPTARCARCARQRLPAILDRSRGLRAGRRRRRAGARIRSACQRAGRRSCLFALSCGLCHQLRCHAHHQPRHRRPGAHHARGAARRGHRGGADRPRQRARHRHHGHVLGGGGAIELVAALRTLARGMLPPTAHLGVPDAAFDLNLVRGEPREARNLRYVLSNSFAFGGTNAVLIAGR